jgi:hypothetical protein
MNDSVHGWRICAIQEIHMASLKQKHRPQSGVAVSFSREKSKERTQNS